MQKKKAKGQIEKNPMLKGAAVSLYVIFHWHTVFYVEDTP